MGRMKLAKETNSTLLARIDERLNGLIKSNNDAHGTITSKIDDLGGKVNHQITSLDERTKILETSFIQTESRFKGRMELFQWTSLILGIVLTGVGLLHVCGLF
jgi:hypothetical protein